MNASHDWLLSEDSFLRHSCSIEERSWGFVYEWDQPVENPKLQFIRILDQNLSLENFQALCCEFEPRFANRGLTFSIKVPQHVTLKPEIMSKLHARGELVFLKSTPLAKTPQHSDVALVQCKTPSELEEFWML